MVGLFTEREMPGKGTCLGSKINRVVGVRHLRKIGSMYLPRAYDIDIRSGVAVIKISSPL